MEKARAIIVCLILLLTTPLLPAALAGEGGAGHVRTAEADMRRLDNSPTERLFQEGEKAFAAQDFDRASVIFTIICSRYSEKSEPEMRRLYAASMNRLGNLNYKKGSFSAAIEYYLKARRLAEKNGYVDLLSEIYTNIGNVYASSADYPTAISFYRKALPTLDSGRSMNVRAMVLNNLTIANYLSGRLDSAGHYLRMYKALNLVGPRFRFDLLLNKGLLYLGENRPDSAIRYFRLAARQGELTPSPGQNTGSAYSQIAECLERQGELDSALVYLHRCEEISTRERIPHFLIETLRSLGRVYEKKGMADKSMRYRSAYLVLSDSISYQEQYNKLKTSETLYELETSADTIRTLNIQKERQRQLLVLAGCFAAVCIIFIIILIRQKRSLKAAWRELYERSRQQLGQNPPPEQGRTLSLNPEQKEKISAGVRRIMDETEDYCDPDFSIEKMAESLDTNARYVSDVVNDVFGKTFRTMLNEYRVRKAIERMEDRENYGKYTVKAIAESVGYRSQSTFIGAFTKMTGLKPGVYRKMAEE